MIRFFFDFPSCLSQRVWRGWLGEGEGGRFKTGGWVSYDYGSAMVAQIDSRGVPTYQHWNLRGDLVAQSSQAEIIKIIFKILDMIL